MKKILTLILLTSTIFSYSQSINENPVAIGELKGTLTTPSQKTNTAILLIAGSGPTDRDGNSAIGLNNNSLKMVAKELTRAGYAVLRYDKRGTAESKDAISSYSELRFQDLVTDAKNWLNELKENGYQNLIVIGHSQGSLVGMIASQNNENVKGLISLAGLSENAGDAIVRQLSAQSKELGSHAKEKIDSLDAGYTVKRYSPLLISLLGPETQPFLKSYIGYTPTEEIKKLSVPILIVNGTTDLQVKVEDAYKLKEAHPEAKLLIIEGMNHILKNAPKDMSQNMKTYNNPDLPLSDGLIKELIHFIETL